MVDELSGLKTARERVLFLTKLLRGESVFGLFLGCRWREGMWTPGFAVFDRETERQRDSLCVCVCVFAYGHVCLCTCVHAPMLMSAWPPWHMRASRSLFVCTGVANTASQILGRPFQPQKV